MNDLLQAGEAGLVVVAVDPKGTDVEALLANAQKKVVAVTDGNAKGTTDDALEKAFESAEA